MFADLEGGRPAGYARTVTDLLVLLGLAAAVAATLAGFRWLAAKVRRSGVGTPLMGPIDQLYRPAAHQFHQESRLGELHAAPRPSADDRPQPSSLP
ncbi:hypothetical protein GCM10009679_39200 [Saccharothrix algeriensis]|uniref:Uncharacterized protein n=1 Tax=Catellatospora bangladeshensis TaxID=310355 RepID=A0A8J3JEE4_9ACTN|nr:hypothetical protein Cba03nite_24380 [Catellatospora bangladeshensis]